MALITEACIRLPMRVVAFFLMPNHLHLALWPYGDGDLSRWMKWLLTTHVRRYHPHYHTCGHVCEGRFKGFPIQEDEHLLTVLRYVERNPLRANLVVRAEHWPWSSLTSCLSAKALITIHPGPVQRHQDWLDRVNAPMTKAELRALRRSVNRERPFGSYSWTAQTARLFEKGVIPLVPGKLRGLGRVVPGQD